MTGRRKVGNLLALAVLSTLYQRPMHRYEMASIMRARNKQQDMNVKWGSLYTVVDNLARHGLVEAVGNSRQGARPERVVYEITAAGRQELVDWTRELVSTFEREHPRFAAGLSVLAVLPPDEVIELLGIRLEAVRAAAAAEGAAMREAAAAVPRLFLIENEYSLAMLAAEADWIQALLDELRSGSHPELERWRTWHHTGELPPDLAELAERGAIADR